MEVVIWSINQNVLRYYVVPTIEPPSFNFQPHTTGVTQMLKTVKRKLLSKTENKTHRL